MLSLVRLAYVALMLCVAPIGDETAYWLKALNLVLIAVFAAHQGYYLLNNIIKLIKYNNAYRKNILQTVALISDNQSLLGLDKKSIALVKNEVIAACVGGSPKDYPFCRYLSTREVMQRLEILKTVLGINDITLIGLEDHFRPLKQRDVWVPNKQKVSIEKLTLLKVLNHASKLILKRIFTFTWLEIFYVAYLSVLACSLRTLNTFDVLNQNNIVFFVIAHAFIGSAVAQITIDLFKKISDVFETLYLFRYVKFFLDLEREMDAFFKNYHPLEGVDPYRLFYSRVELMMTQLFHFGIAIEGIQEYFQAKLDSLQPEVKPVAGTKAVKTKPKSNSKLRRRKKRRGADGSPAQESSSSQGHDSTQGQESTQNDEQRSSQLKGDAPVFEPAGSVVEPASTPVCHEACGYYDSRVSFFQSNDESNRQHKWNSIQDYLWTLHFLGYYHGLYGHLSVMPDIDFQHAYDNGYHQGCTQRFHL